jgi:signal transduction histidine kinase
MSETLGKLVELSRASKGPDNALVQRVDLAAMVGGVIDQLGEMAEVRGVEIRAADGLPAITVDVARLELILLNLVSNAIKYSDPDKPVRFVGIAVAPADRPDVFTLAVRDNGLGIAESDQRTVFARFYRGHADRDRQLGTDGLGLGLSIVADCVDALKGAIRVDSRPREGTTFFVDLPSSMLG